MNSDYVAWNGERYVWPPPEGWYLASDGRWWAPDTSPDMDLDAAGPGLSSTTDSTPTEQTPRRSTHFAPAETIDASYDPNRDDVASSPVGAAAATAHPATGQIPAVPGSDATTAMSSGADRLNPTMVMAEPPRTRTGQHATVSVDPDSEHGEHQSILEPTDAPPAPAQRSRTMTMVAAGLLVAAAIGIAGLLALLGGDNETQTQQPSASAEDSDDGSGELVVSEDADTPTSADDAMDDGAMDDGAMDDAMGEGDDVMADEGQDSTSSTAAGSTDGGADAAMIGQFRTLLEDNQITAAELTGDDLVVFGQTACSYATSAADLPEYEQIRDEALNGAQNDELSIEELQFVVDTAVTVFCAEDATRLGLTATAPVEG